MKILIIIVLITAVIISYMLFMTPYFAAKLIRAVFEKTEHSPPQDYEQISRSVTIYNDVTYPSEYGSNVLDIYLPKNSDQMLKTIIWAHGGGYIGGDKHETRYFAASLAAKGYAVVSLNYDRAPEVHYPVPLIQLSEVYEFIKSENPYNLDAAQLVFAGSSAGAHCAAQFITIQSSKEYADLIGIRQTVPLEDITAVLLYCGPYDYETFGTQSSSGLMNFMMGRAMWAYFGTRDWGRLYGHSTTLKYHVTSEFPPTFITDGNTGSFESDGKELEQTLRNLGVFVESYFIDVNNETIGHEYQYDMHTPAGKTVFNYTINFLKKL